MAEREGQPGEPAVRAQYYVNTARVEATVYDIGFIFGMMSDGESSEILAVRMSPQHAKSVAILLARFLATYEREVGAIVLPESLIAQLSGEETQDAADSQE